MREAVGRLVNSSVLFLKQLANRVFRAVNNMKLGNKMILMSVCCVLIPLIITDMALLSAISRDEYQRRATGRENELGAAENCLDNMKDYMNTAIVSLYTNSGLYSFLDKSYAGPGEYYEAYLQNKSIVNNAMFGANTYIKKLAVYADNDTVYDGGGYYRLSSAKSDDWYVYFNESGYDIAVYPNKEKTNIAYNNLRTVSFMSRLNYGKHGGNNRHVVKLDLNYSYFTENLRQQNFSDDIYICDDELIIFSTREKSTGTEDFRSVSEMDGGSILMSDDYSICGQNWHIYVVEKAGTRPLSVIVLEKNAGWFIALAVINILLPLAVIYVINRSIVRRLIDLGDHISMVKESKYEEIDYDGARDEIGTLIGNYNLMVKKIQDLILNVYEGRMKQQDYEIARQKAELLALHSQINPHFMFNALESIRMRSLIKKENETAGAIELLAVLMRKSTDWCDDLVTLEEEISFAEAYLKLQKYRFGDRLSYNIDIADECKGLKVPKLTLVTFVENACVHGVEKVTRPCTVLLTAVTDSDRLIMYIEDTGAGISEQKREKLLGEMLGGDMNRLMEARSVGILNACLRLRRCFDDSVIFEIDSEQNVGTCVTITIPLEKMK